MKITGTPFQNMAHVNKSLSKKLPSQSDFAAELSTVFPQTDKQENGKVLSIAMLKEPGTNRFWGMKAKYASCSTKDNPVIYVETNYGGKTVSYNVSINEVNPKNGSRLEMFALCAYADAIGEGDQSTLGTYNTLRTFEEMANHNGYIDSETDDSNMLEQFKNAKLNWMNLSQKTTDLLFKSNDIKQYKKGLHIIEMLSKHLVK